MVINFVHVIYRIIFIYRPGSNEYPIYVIIISHIYARTYCNNLQLYEKRSKLIKKVIAAKYTFIK